MWWARRSVRAAAAGAADAAAPAPAAAGTAAACVMPRMLPHAWWPRRCTHDALTACGACAMQLAGYGSACRAAQPTCRMQHGAWRDSWATMRAGRSIGPIPLRWQPHQVELMPMAMAVAMQVIGLGLAHEQRPRVGRPAPAPRPLPMQGRDERRQRLSSAASRVANAVPLAKSVQPSTQCTAVGQLCGRETTQQS